jgi:hypothetical protein
MLHQSSPEFYKSFLRKTKQKLKEIVIRNISVFHNEAFGIQNIFKALNFSLDL